MEKQQVILQDVQSVFQMMALLSRLVLMGMMTMAMRVDMSGFIKTMVEHGSK